MNKDKKPKSTTVKQQESPKKKGGAAVIISVVLLLLIVSSLVIVFMLNVGNARGMVLGLFGYHPPEETVIEQDDRETQIRDKLIALDTREEDLNTRETQLTERELELNTRIADFEIREQEIETLGSQLEIRAAEISSIAALYTNMEPEQAASILSQMTNQDNQLLVLKNMGESEAGEILALMDSTLAAGIIERMMTENQE